MHVLYHQDLSALELGDGGKRVVIKGVEKDFAAVIASALKLHMITTRTLYVRDDVAPQVLETKEASVEIWNYPKHPDNQ